jgi:hypothetical protein
VVVNAPTDGEMMTQRTVTMRKLSGYPFVFLSTTLKVLFGKLNAKLATEDIFKTTIGN